MLGNGLFGVNLHATVNSCINFKPILKKVVVMLRGPVHEKVPDHRSEVGCQALVVTINFVLKSKVLGPEGVVRHLADFIILSQIVQHLISLSHRGFRIEDRAVAGGGVYQPNQ